MTKQTTHIAPVGLSIADACRAAGIGRSMLYEEIAAGRLKTFKVGRRRLVSPRALQEWADAKQRAAAA